MVATSPPVGADPGDVVYSRNFDDVADGTLPDSWKPVTGEWAVQDGELMSIRSIVRTDGNPVRPSRSIAARIANPPIDATGSVSRPCRYCNTSSSMPSALEEVNDVDDTRERSSSPCPERTR